MSDDLYDRDILVWSQQQADLLRRMARGERVNHVDWENLVEEIEDVGRSVLYAVQSYLRLIIVHALKLHAWPDSDSCRHWHEEIAAFQADARQRFAPSMRQKIDLDLLYRDAVRQVGKSGQTAPSPRQFAQSNPFALDELLNADSDDLLHRLEAAPAVPDPPA